MDPFSAELARGNLRGAGEWLVRLHAGDVLSLCATMVRDRSAAEDLAQDVFARAFNALGSYRGEASARTWLLSIAHNRCRDHLRQQKRSPWADAAADEPDGHADEAPLPPELLSHRAEVEHALGTLAEMERALVVLRFRHGLEYAELADTFGLREGALRMRVARALGRMREVLEAHESVTARFDAPPLRRRGEGAVPASAPPSAPLPATPPPPPPSDRPPFHDDMPTPVGGIERPSLDEAMDRLSARPGGHVTLRQVLVAIEPPAPPALSRRLLALATEILG